MDDERRREQTGGWCLAMTTCHLLILSAILTPVLARAGLTTMDRTGRILSLNIAGEELAVAANLRVPLKGWGKQPSLADARDVKVATADGRTTYSGRIELEPGKTYTYVETVEDDGASVTLDLKVTAEADVDIEGVFLWLDLPQAAFRGGRVELSAGGAAVARATLPEAKPASRYVVSGDSDAMNVASATEAASLTANFDRAIPVTVQDDREWNVETYTAFCRLAPSLRAGETTSLRVTLAPAIQPDTTAAAVEINSSRVRYNLDGFGGNYCFAVGSPVTQYTLQNLRIAWARVEMKAAQWEPEYEKFDPNHINWPALEARDTPGSELRRDFEVARQIQRLGVPFVISIWDLPGWLYEDGGKAPRNSVHRIAADKWPELLELIGSYLLYAKRQYGVEPDLFSFNEANIGIRVLLTPEEHREEIKRLGAHFRSLGLKTKMLLGDATGPRGTYAYCLPAADDPEAMQYVGAVGFHSWGGGSPKDYSAWGDLAERLKLPLLVTELGTDAGAWQTAAYDNFSYALGEVQMYQELLLYARPQGTMQWEFTGDYGTVKQEKDAHGNELLVPTVRFWFVKHFCNLTPHHAGALATTSDNPKVLATAFSAQQGDQQAFTVHIANFGAARQATVTGLPAGLTRLRAVRTSAEDSFRDLGEVEVVKGAVKLDLTAQSLLTLTTMTEK